MNPKEFVLNGEIIECACVHSDASECAGIRDYGDRWFDMNRGPWNMRRHCECPCHKHYEEDDDDY